MSQPTADDLELLQREVQALQRQLASERVARTARIRTVIGWVLTVLAVVATTLSLLSVWTFRTLTNTDLFVERVGAVIDQPEVAAAVGDAAAEQLVEALQLQRRLQERLPDEVSVAAGPITSAAENYLAQGATRLVQTDGFESAWDAALTAGHELSIGILSGSDTTAIENSDGVVVLDLTPVVNLLLAEGSDFISDLLGRDVTAPTVTPDTIDQAVAALEQQLGTDLPADFGQVTLFASDDLATAQTWYQTARIATWLAPLVAAVLIGLAIAVAPRRGRTALVIVVGTGLLLGLVAVALEPLQSALVGAVQTAGLSGAVGAGFQTVVSSLLSGIVLVAGLAVAAAFLLFVTGDNAVAVAGRSALGHTPSLAATHRGWFLGGGALMALILLAVIPGRSWGQLLVVLLIYAAYALAVMLAPRRDAPVEVEAVP